LSGPAAQRRPELFELEFEDEFDELLDELFEDEFELEFDEEFELELELEFDELLDELFEASCRRASVVATASVSGVATRAWAPSTPTVTSAAVASVVAVIIFFMSLSCWTRPSLGRSAGERAGDRFIPAFVAESCGAGSLAGASGFEPVRRLRRLVAVSGFGCAAALIDREEWLGRQDSNLGMAVPKTAALPLGDAPSWGGS